MKVIHLNYIPFLVLAVGLFVSSPKFSLPVSLAKEMKASIAKQDKILDSHSGEHDHVHVKKMKCKHGICAYV